MGVWQVRIDVGVFDKLAGSWKLEVVTFIYKEVFVKISG